MGRVPAPVVLGLCMLFSGGPIACGGRTPIERPPALDSGTPDVPEEVCNRADDDGDGQVDEAFRDIDGRYVTDAHCGGCGRACDRPIANADEVGCELLAGAPTCVARSCAEGFGRAQGGGCVALDRTLCLPCRDDGDCGALLAARCVSIGGEQRCARDCSAGCPSGYICFAGEHCVPEGESCTCESGSPDFELACSASAPSGELCAGQARCRDGRLSACSLPEEQCDGVDDDCDGEIDEDFVDARGVYGKDPRHCGACGADCTADESAGVELTCGGDPFAPSCVVLCPDLLDGVQVGDLLDADRVVSSGCECTVASLTDSVGTPLREGQIDSNCDGADGELLASVYVAIGGSDDNLGSPTRPLRTIQAAIDLARDSLFTDEPRPDVFVASGTYTESLELPAGVRLHGGYRRDFLSLDPDGFEVVVRAPADTTAHGGAALSIGAGRASSLGPTLVEGFSFRGRDAERAGATAIGVEIIDPIGEVILRDVRIRTGKPGAGQDGLAGVAGTSPSRAASDGQPQRAAVENAAHACLPLADNRVLGGAGGISRCIGIDVSGGAGGAPRCPAFGALAPAGVAGKSAGSARGGSGGNGGRDLSGPIDTSDSSCNASVCCGLADFVVPDPFELPGAGLPGDDGTNGLSGDACTDPLGAIVDGRWRASRAGPGGGGQPGGGGGGGGSGGGVEMAWFAGECAWPDGLGGAGGGGGGGGCGGTGGQAGSSGGAAIGLLIRLDDRASVPPTLNNVEITAEAGAPGGRGGAGGDGGLGGSGGFGGRVPDAERTTPPLAGPLPGERGGKGGDGGAGGGGGGGCGGSALGIWLTGSAASSDIGNGYLSGNRFTLGAAGAPGEGGGGAVRGPAGAAGLRLQVVTR